MISAFQQEGIQLKLLVLLLCLFVLSSVLNTPWLVKSILYSFTLIGLALFLDFKKTIFNGLVHYYPYLIFSSLCIISFLSVLDTSVELRDSPQIENIVALFILFIFLTQLQIHYFEIMNTLILITTIFLLISIPIHFFYFESPLLSGTAFLPPSLEKESLSTKNTLGVFLVVLFPLCIYKLSQKMNIYNFFVVMLFSLAIFYTFSRGALILFSFTMLFFLFTGNRTFIKATGVTLLSIMFLLFVFQVTPSKYNDLKTQSKQQVNNDMSYSTDNLNKTFTLKSARAEYIIKSINGFMEKPVFGHGLSTFRRNHPYYTEGGEYIRFAVTHNDYAQVLYELGILGIISFLYLFIFNLIRLSKVFSEDKNRSIIILLQIILLAISLNSINLLDHTFFWVVLALTLSKKVNYSQAEV